MPGRPGEIVGYITVPRLGLFRWPMRMGIRDQYLDMGVAVYRGAAKPGEGNLATAGHRVTPVNGRPYGPYYHLDTLVSGDTATVFYEGKRYRYELKRLFITTPDNTQVLGDGPADLTMTACHPKGSAAQRIIAWWTLV